MAIILRTRKHPYLKLMYKGRVLAEFKPVIEQLTDEQSIKVGECVVEDEKTVKTIMKIASPDLRIQIVGRRSDQPLHVLDEEEETEDIDTDDDSEEEEESEDDEEEEESEDDEEEEEPEPEPKKRAARKRK